MALMNIIVWLIVGAIAGWAAGYVVNKNTAFNIMDLVIGILGAVVGGWISTLIPALTPYGLIGQIVMAFVGAVILAFGYKKLTGGTSN